MHVAAISDYLPSKCIGTLRGHKAAVLCAQFNKDGTYCLSTGQDRAVILWNPEKELLIKEYKGHHNQEINDVCIFDDNSKFITVGGDKLFFMWDVATGQIIRKFIGHNGKINSCKLNHTEGVICTGSFDQTLKIWDLKAFSKYPIQTLNDCTDSVTSICCTDHEIICGSLDGCVRSYDIRKGRVLMVEFHHPVVSISLSSDNDFLLASCLDNTIRLVNTSTGDLFSQYSGHTCQQYTISSCLDPSDSIVVSGSEDNRIYFWDLVNGNMMKQPQPGEVLHSIHEHKGIVFCTKFHAESRKMLSTSSDTTVKIWSCEQEK